MKLKTSTAITIMSFVVITGLFMVLAYLGSERYTSTPTASYPVTKFQRNLQWGVVQTVHLRRKANMLPVNFEIMVTSFNPSTKKTTTLLPWSSITLLQSSTSPEYYKSSAGRILIFKKVGDNYELEPISGVDRTLKGTYKKVTV